MWLGLKGQGYLAPPLLSFLPAAVSHGQPSEASLARAALKPRAGRVAAAAAGSVLAAAAGPVCSLATCVVICAPGE